MKVEFKLYSQHRTNPVANSYTTFSSNFTKATSTLQLMGPLTQYDLPQAHLIHGFAETLWHFYGLQHVVIVLLLPSLA